jgi:serine/threonine protein kinase
MIPMTCPADDKILPLVTGEAGDRSVVEHLTSCSDCRRRLSSMAAEVRSLRAKWDDPTPAPWTGIDVSVDRTRRDDSTGRGPTEYLASPEPAAAAVPDGAGADGLVGDQAPARIGKYLVVGVLDAGGQATVYRVVHPGIGRELALKIAKRPWCGGALAGDPTVSEAQLLGDLDHPGLVRVHDLDVDAGRLFLVMEYVRGRSLHQFARDQPVNSRHAVRLVAQVARAAEAVHCRGIVHQDIKPRNILVDESGRARLIDFGTARWRHAWSIGEEGPSGGTPEFMAPEQAQDKADLIGPRSDVFALGAVLYFLLTGRPPFQGQDRRAVWDSACRCDFDREVLKAKGVPRRLRRIVLKAMSATPSGRHPTAANLAAALEAYFQRPIRVALAAMFLLFAASLVAYWTLPPEGGARGPSGQPGAAQPGPATLPALEGAINVMIWNPDASDRQRLNLIDRDALPLRRGDQVRIEATVNRPAYLYIVWIDTEGLAQPVYPWVPGDWSRFDAAERPAIRVSLPQTADKAWPIKPGPPGMETLLLLARESPLPPRFDLRDRLTSLPRSAPQDARALVWFDDWALVQGGREGSRERGPSFFPVDVKDPVVQTQALLKERLVPYFTMMRAVSFANRGD